MLKEDFKNCNEILTCYAIEITKKFLTSWHNEYYYVSCRWSFWKCAEKCTEIRIMRFCRYRFQYYKTDQMCSHNQDSIEICSVQQAEIDEELLYTESWHFEAHIDWHTYWVLSSHKLLY